MVNIADSSSHCIIPATSTNVYIKDPKTPDFDDYHLACQFCWYHCPHADNALRTLAEHVNQAYHPVNVDPSKNGNGSITGPQLDGTPNDDHLPQGNHNDEDKTLDDVLNKITELIDMLHNFIMKNTDEADVSLMC